MIAALQTGSEDGAEIPGRRVLVGATELRPNPQVPDDVRAVLGSLPSQMLPRKQARPIKRLTSLAHELAADGLLPDAGKLAHRAMHAVLDGLLAGHADEIADRRKGVLEVEGRTISAALDGPGRSFDDFVEMADRRVIEDAFHQAGRIISPDLAKSYCEHLVRNAGSHGDPVESLIDARITVAALGRLLGLKRDVETAAEAMGRSWLDDHRDRIKGLSDERQDIYRQLRAMSVDPVEVEMVCPTSRMQPSLAKEASGTEVPLPRYRLHLLAAEDDLYPDDLNGPETEALKVELARPDVVGWYRNPSVPGPDSMGIRYELDGEWEIMRPDFILFSRLHDGGIGVGLVDPHGHHLADALPRLRGLAAFAADHGASFVRILALSGEVGAQRVLDMNNAAVCEAVGKATSAKLLFESEVAHSYQ